MLFFVTATFSDTVWQKTATVLRIQLYSKVKRSLSDKVRNHRVSHPCSLHDDLCSSRWLLLLWQSSQFDLVMDAETTVTVSGSCTTKQVQRTQGAFLLSGFSYLSISSQDKRSHKASYQLGKLTQGFPCAFP